MKKRTMRPVLAVIFFVLCALSSVKAQEDKLLRRHFDRNNGKNILKLNLWGIPVKNLYVEYERVLNKRFSANLGLRGMPASRLPLGRTFYDQLAQNDSETYRVLNTLRMSNMAITPEIRLYTGKKGAGQGFYFSAFYRYATHRIGKLSVDFEDAQGAQQFLDLTGKLSLNSVGLQIGAQWKLGRSMMLDWWILGPHLGNADVELSGQTTLTLTADDQAEIRNALDDSGILNSQYTKVSVNAHGASVLMRNAPWGGIKAGLCLGIRF